MTTAPRSARLEWNNPDEPASAGIDYEGFLAPLHELTLDLMGHSTVAELLPMLARQATTLLQGRTGEILLLQAGDLVVTANFPETPPRLGERIRANDSGAAWNVISLQQPIVLESSPATASRPDFCQTSAAAQTAILPIIRGNDCTGVVAVSREVGAAPFTAAEVRAGLQFTRIAARVLLNTKRHESTVQAADARATALRESEERFRALFDQSPLVITLVSLSEGTLVELNHAAVAAFGYSHAEMLGQSPLDLNLWVDPSRRPLYFETLRANGRVTDFEAEFRRRDGEVFTALCSGTLVSIAGLPYAINSIQDITAAKQAAAVGERSLALMRATLESTADGILVVNEEGRIETYNANFADMWDLPLQPAHSRIGEEPILRQVLDQLVSPELFLAGVRELYSRSDDEVFDILHCKDGRIFERFSRPQLVGSQLAGRVWSFRDITDERRAEAALRESEERFRVLAEVSPVGIFSADGSGRTTFVNARWTEFAGVSAAEALAHGWAQALHPGDKGRVAAAWNEAIRAGSAWTAEFRFVRPDGTVTWLVGQSRPQRNAAGETTGHVGTITDVTSLKRAEEERKKLETQLRQSSKMESLGTLAGGIAHDFNNILTGTFGFVDLARLELAPGHPAQLWLDKIAGSSHRARDLVRQILVFSRKDEGVRISQRLHSPVNEALRMLRSMLPPMVALEMQISSETPPVLADPNQVQQLIFNLCTNAWHA